MEVLTLLFVLFLLAAALFITLIVRRDFLAREQLERQRQHQRTLPRRRD